MRWQALHQGIVQDATASRQNLRPASLVAGAIVNLPSAHRQLGKQAAGRLPFKQRRMVPMSRSGSGAALPAFVRQVDLWLARVSPRRRSPGHEKKASDQMGRQPAQAYS